MIGLFGGFTDVDCFVGFPKIFSELFVIFSVLFLVGESALCWCFFLFLVAVTRCVSCITAVLAYQFRVVLRPLSLLSSLVVRIFLLCLVSLLRTILPFLVSSFAAAITVAIHFGFLLWFFVHWYAPGVVVSVYCWTSHWIRGGLFLAGWVVVLELSLDECFDLFLARLWFACCRELVLYCIGSFPKKNVSTNSATRSPNAYLAAFIRVFRNSGKFCFVES